MEGKEYLKKLHASGFLPGPEKCICGNKNLNIQKLASKKSGFCFRCMVKNCKRYYPLRANSFFSKFTHMSIDYVIEVIKCNLSFKFNINKTKKYLAEEKNILYSSNAIREIYNEIRKTIYLYYILKYESEEFAQENRWAYYAAEESEFTHINNMAIWVVNVIDTNTKEFRLEVTKSREAINLKKFISKFIPPGNFIITDGWAGYSWLNDNGYERLEHNHGRNDWGSGNEATSHSENIWNVLKDEIKSTYKSIQNKNFLYFLREAEFKYNNRNKSYRI